MQLESHTRSVVAMTRDQMEQLRFRGRGAVVWLGTLPAPTHNYAQSYAQANSRKAGSAATEAELKKPQKFQDISNLVRALTSFQSPSSHPEFGSACHGTGLGDWTPAFRSQPRTTVNIVSGLLWLFNAAMPPVLLGHCSMNKL